MMQLPSGEAGREMELDVSAEPGSKALVAVAFKKWDPTTNRLDDGADSGDFEAVVRVPTGTQEYIEHWGGYL